MIKGLYIFLLICLFLQIHVYDGYQLWSKMPQWRWAQPPSPLPPSSTPPMITISPSGLHGYYFLGIMSYLKDHYDLRNYVFSGASAGAWISLLMSYKGNHHEIVNDVLKTSHESSDSIQSIGKGLRDLLLKSGKYRTADFDLNRCYMGLIQLNWKTWPMQSRTLIYHDFTSLEDAVQCCIASSHVPFIMGRALRKYRNLYAIDGGFDPRPYYGSGHMNGDCIGPADEGVARDCTIDPRYNAKLHIHPFIWYDRNVTVIEYLGNQFRLFLDLFQTNQMNYTELYWKGYRDAEKQSQYLDKFM